MNHPAASVSQRQGWIATLANAPAVDLVALATHWAHVHVELLRPPGTGLVMLRARIGGSGDRFNIGEATVTRCVLRCAGTPNATLGVGYALGRDGARARAIALFDALLQQAEHHERVVREVISPLAARIARERADARACTASSRVEFSTLQSEAST